MLKFLQNIKIHPKWPLSTLLLVATIFGVFLGQQQSTLPNQEIVLEFSNQDISLDDAQHTITIVEQELKRAGIEDIHVSKQEDGKLIISYYSKTTVDQIKKILTARKELALGFINAQNGDFPFKLPKENPAFSYNLKLYEIQDGQNAVSDLNGKSAVELKSGQFRFLNPNFCMDFDHSQLVKEIPLLQVEFNFQNYIAIVEDYRSHKIPEVRAGPLC